MVEGAPVGDRFSVQCSLGVDKSALFLKDKPQGLDPIFHRPPGRRVAYTDALGYYNERDIRALCVKILTERGHKVPERPIAR